MQTESSPPSEAPALRSGVVTLLGAATLGVVMLSPAITLYGNFAAAFESAGRAAPVPFVWALFATLPTAASYAWLSRDYPAAGSAAAWTQRALGNGAAQWLGLMAVAYYMSNFVLQPVTFGLFSSDLAEAVGLSPGIVPYVVGAVLCCALPAAFVYRGISPSTSGALGLLVIESIVVVLLCATAAWLHPAGPLDLEGFLPSTSPTGAAGLWQAMVFAVLSFCGFDVISTLAEEAKLPRKMIPQATFLALLSFGAVIILGIWALTFAAPPGRLLALAAAPGMPITALSRDLWGKGSLLVLVTGLTAALGIVIATSVGASRVLFSLAREGLLPQRFARLHPRWAVPWEGLHLVFTVGLAGALIAAIIVGPWSAYLWWGLASTFFAVITFFFVNLAALVLLPRLATSRGGRALYTLVPLLGLGVDLVIFVRCFLVEALSKGWFGRSAILFDLLCAALAAATLLRRPQASRTP